MRLFLLFIGLNILSVKAQNKSVEVIDLNQLNVISSKSNDTLYVINFWATWCKPCVEELPYFIQTATDFKAKAVKIYLISLDFASQKDKVEKFILEKRYTLPVFILSAGNPNNWIDKIDTTWSGAIPATVMYQNGKKVDFVEGELTLAELQKRIRKQKK